MSAEAAFKALIDRILRCREAEDEAKADTKEVYKELKAQGYDKTAAGALVAELRKREKNPAKFSEAGTMLDLYRDAYERATGTVVATHTHEDFQMDRAAEGSLETGSVAAEKGRKAIPAGPEGADLNHAGAGEIPATIPDRVKADDESAIRPLRAAGSAPDEIPAPIPQPPQTPCPAADQTGEAGPTTSPVAPISDDEVPAFVRKPMRPHCLNPQACAGVGYRHCYSCTKAAKLDEAAA